jgi:hypothetical protein
MLLLAVHCLTINPRLQRPEKSQSYVTTKSGSLSWYQDTIWGPQPNFFLLSDSYGLCAVPSVTRGQGCSLQLLLCHASAVILESKSCRTHDHILLYQSRDPTWKARSPYLYPPATGWPSCTNRHWVLFWSPRPWPKSKLKSRCDWRPINVSWCWAPGTHPGPMIRFLFLSDGCGCVDVGRLLCQEDGHVVYNCCWALSMQSISGLNPTGIMTIFYYLKFALPQTGRRPGPCIYIPQE